MVGSLILFSLRSHIEFDTRSDIPLVGYSTVFNDQLISEEIFGSLYLDIIERIDEWFV